ncbi:glycine-rich protein [Nocardia iowensis]|uniref:receptor protein-tyrosine kinase n=1 Tax=Nocardia iowensis TaxID=204891 RepID=A0ABX8RGB6_NOCIO|nr:glycine-rich protein [Nocardia iowensis]QXN88645.1 hypothetical protein KV110_23955 [Nocardia iowensis]
MLVRVGVVPGMGGIRWRGSRFAAGIIVAAGCVVATPGTAAADLPPGCSESGDMVTCIYQFTGGEQTFEVPGGVTSVRVTAIGGRAAFNNNYPGDMVVAPLDVVPETTLYVMVGGSGGDGPDRGGFNGGGPGGGGNFPGVGGGGASDVRLLPSDAPGSLRSRLIVAAGAPGPSGFHSPGRGRTGGDATTEAGGTGATPDPGGAAGSDGALAAGGAGGDGYCGGGGGAGGYYGGGGGASAPNLLTCGDGGKGSSYGPADAVISRPRPVEVAVVKIQYAAPR